MRYRGRRQIIYQEDILGLNVPSKKVLKETVIFFAYVILVSSFMCNHCIDLDFLFYFSSGELCFVSSEQETNIGA